MAEVLLPLLPTLALPNDPPLMLFILCALETSKPEEEGEEAGAGVVAGVTAVGGLLLTGLPQAMSIRSQTNRTKSTKNRLFDE